MLADILMCNFFFFSSRRRHTRFDCDWSSDVCSSDLISIELDGTTFTLDERAYAALRSYLDRAGTRLGLHPDRAEVIAGRSEERRVGKECRSRWSAYHEKKDGGSRTLCRCGATRG